MAKKTKTQKLIDRCKELGLDTESLTNNTLREEAIAKKEAELAEAAKKTESKTIQVNTKPGSSEQESKPEQGSGEDQQDDEEQNKAEKPKTTSKKSPKSYKDERGRVWKFKKNAPKTINIDGHPMSQEEILGTEEVIAELVYGNSSFLTQ